MVILRKMKEDLDFAVTKMVDNGDKGVPSRGAAAHLLTKINLALGLFDDAITSANLAINGPYALMTGPFRYCCRRCYKKRSLGFAPPRE
jgi:hypothetical protein